MRSDYVARFNEGVRTGDWTSMLELLADDAELEFVGIPVGPLRGKRGIREAYESQPPDDEIVLLGGDAYAWARAPGTRAGELHFEERDGAITHIRVVHER